MKTTLTLLALAATVSAAAQCTDYTCADATNQATVGCLSSSYDGSTCFSGTGEVPNWVNVNNWSVLSVDGEIDYLQNINFGSLGTKLVSSGNNSFAYWSLDGGDTVYVKSGATQVASIITNNSWEGNWNTVAVNEGAEFYYAGIQYDPWAAADGVITLSVAGGTGNKLKITTGCSDEPLPIQDTKWYGYVRNGKCVVSWNSYTNGALQYSPDGKHWSNIRQDAGLVGTIEVDAQERNFFRLLAEGYYSTVFPLYYKVEAGKGVEVDILGRPVQGGAAGIYIENGVKKFKL